jgi:peptide/nickel transport system substrate-binding protein
MEVVNDKTFQLVLKDPFGLVLEALAKPSSEDGQPGQRVVYVRNPAYVPRPEPPSFAAGGNHRMA